MTPGKVYGCLELQKVVSKNFDFRENFENHDKIVNLQKKFSLIEEKMVKDWATIKSWK